MLATRCEKPTDLGERTLEEERTRGTGREAPSVSGKTKERSIIWSSEEGLMVDASEPHGEEGRDKLRKAAGRSTYPMIRG
jgi:hypothetical protein